MRIGMHERLFYNFKIYILKVMENLFKVSFFIRMSFLSFHCCPFISKIKYMLYLFYHPLVFEKMSCQLNFFLFFSFKRLSISIMYLNHFPGPLYEHFACISFHQLMSTFSLFSKYIYQVYMSDFIFKVDCLFKAKLCLHEFLFLKKVIKMIIFINCTSD